MEKNETELVVNIHTEMSSVQLLRLCDEYDGQEHYFDISEKAAAMRLMADWVYTTGRLDIYLELLQPHHQPVLLIWADHVWTPDLVRKRFISCPNCNYMHEYVGDLRSSCDDITTREIFTSSGKISTITAKCAKCNEHTLPISFTVTTTGAQPP